jgi:hypothetical protein
MPIDPDALPMHFPPLFDAAPLASTDSVTLGEARAYMRHAAMRKGSKCPCCGGFVRFYQRRINKTMARCLEWLAATSGPDLLWVNVPKDAPRWLLRSNQLATLRHWKLVEKQEQEKSKSKSSGIWRPTRLGYDWAIGLTEIPEFVVLYKGKTLVCYGPPHRFTEALDSDGFDFDEIMEPVV